MLNFTSLHTPNYFPGPSVLGEDSVLSELFPALIQCFAVILMGYFSARFNVISSSHAKGLGIYVTKFALPAVFFRVMLTIDFSNVSWRFVLAVSLSKAIMFAVTFLISLLLYHPMNLSLCGILSIFTTQSNDVALGFPIVSSLYPNYASYIYLFGPAQLLILNPLAFLLMEWNAVRESHSKENYPRITSQNQKTIRQTGETSRVAGTSSSNPTTSSSLNSDSNDNLSHRIYVMFRNLLLNPLVFMTIIGVILNFILGHKIPIIIDGVLKVLADSFPAAALFYLGHGMSNKFGKLSRRGIYILVFILLAKQIFMPFMMRELVRLFDPGLGDINKTLDYTTVAFLYGSLPTAPPVYLFAVQFKLIPEVIASGLVIGTFLCGPLMYVTARLVTLTSYPPNLISSTSFNMSILSIVSCAWVFVILILSRRICRLPHQITACLLTFFLFSCIGMLLDGAVHQANYHRFHHPLLTTPNATWQQYLQFVLFYVGIVGSRLWTVILAIFLVITRWKSLCFFLRLRFTLYTLGFCLPFIITGLLMICSSQQTMSEIDPAFQYGRGQTIVSLGVLLFSFLTSSVLMIIYARLTFKHDHGSTQTHPHVPGASDEENLLHGDSSNETSRSDSTDDQSVCRARLLNHVVSEDAEQSSSCAPRSTSRNGDIEEFIQEHTCHSERCTPSQRQKCLTLLKGYWDTQRAVTSVLGDTNTQTRHSVTISTHESDVDPSSIPVTGDPSTNTNVILDAEVNDMQMHRHALFIIVLLFTMSMGIFLCIWRLVKEEISGIYIELEFLDCFFNFGQGFLAFCVFGLDTNLIILPCQRRINQFFNGLETSADRSINRPSSRSIRKDSHVDCPASFVNDQRRRIML